MEQEKIDVAMVLAVRKYRETSNDPKTQTGAAVLTKDGVGVAINANLIMHPAPEELNREQRLAYALHAEVHALLSCQDVVGGTIYTYGTPCHECAKVIITRGIMRVVIDHDEDPFKDRLDAPEYHFDWAFQLFEGHGVNVVRLSMVNQCAEQSADDD